MCIYYYKYLKAKNSARFLASNDNFLKKDNHVSFHLTSSLCWVFSDIRNFISMPINTLMYDQDWCQLQTLPQKHCGFLHLLEHFLRDSSLSESDSSIFLSRHQNTLCVCVCVCVCVCFLSFFAVELYEFFIDFGY